jgi:putative acetyltransferase
MITIQPYYSGVELELFEIFTSAIREVCIKDYSPEQISAWLPSEYRDDKWRERLEGINPYIAVYEGNISGYADMQDDGYIDHFFVGAKYQSQGVGNALMATLLEKSKSDRAYSHVSLTARPFFEKKGFTVVKENTVNMRGVDLRNYLMERWSK